MKVKDLIDKLKEFDPELPVKVYNSGSTRHEDPIVAQIEAWTDDDFEDNKEPAVEIFY